MNRILIENCQNKIVFNSEQELLIKKTVETVSIFEGFNLPFEVSITIVENSEIKEINSKHRNINKPTDVLSFPMTGIHEGNYKLEELKYDMDDGILILGDIIISIEKVFEQAEEYGHSVDRELSYLTAHGMFHLFGYNHMEMGEERIMINKQDEVMKLMGLNIIT
jgi:probable rRNA maturation factor